MKSVALLALPISLLLVGHHILSVKTAQASMSIQLQQGTISGYIWDDVDRGKTKNGTEPVITSSTFEVRLYTSSGVQVGSVQTPNGSGIYTFSNVPVGSNYEVRITTPSGYCSGDATNGATGWNDGSTTFTYTNATSPFETGEAITASAGATTTVNLGVLTDFFPILPNGQPSVQPGGNTTFTIKIPATPCWMGSSVTTAFHPAPGEETSAPYNWPACLTVTTLTPTNPGSQNPADPANNTTSITVAAASGCTPGNYNFSYTSDIANPLRSHQLGTSISVGQPSTPWITLINGDAYSNYTGASNGINYVLTNTPCCNFDPYFISATNSGVGNSLGGIAISPSGINVPNESGIDVTSERGFESENYPNENKFPFSDLDFSFITNNCGNWQNLPPNTACKADNTVVPPHYNLSGTGVVLTYFTGDVIINNSAYSSQNPATQRMIMVVNGDVTIKQNVGSPSGTADADIDAEIVVLNGHKVVIEDNQQPDYQVKIRGALLISGKLENLRTMASNTAPSLIIESDPFVFMNPIAVVARPKVIWREVNPIRP